VAKKKTPKKTPPPPPMDDDDFDDDFDAFGFNPFDIMDDMGEPVNFWGEPDFLLADIVQMMVNIMGMEIGVTLFIKGMIVTGMLVSEKEYLSTLTEVFRSRVHINERKMSKTERDEFDKIFDFTRLSESDIGSDMDEDDSFPPFDPAPIRFLHLKNPMMISPQPMSFGHGALPIIRLRVSMVDGWMLGEAISSDMFEDNGSNEFLH